MRFSIALAGLSGLACLAALGQAAPETAHRHAPAAASTPAAKPPAAGMQAGKPSAGKPAAGKPAEPAPRAQGGYVSVFEGYVPHADPEPIDWRRANDAVREAGGHIGILKSPPAPPARKP